MSKRDPASLLVTPPEQLREERIGGATYFEGQILTLRLDTVRLPNGGEAKREAVYHRGAVAILPLLSTGEVLVEEQYRYPHERIFLEIPAGKLDSSDEDPLLAAHRELREETGYRAGRMIPLGEFVPSPAILSEKLHLFLALDLTEGERSPDEDEFLAVRRIPLSELVSAVLDGMVPDGKTQAAALRAAAMLERGLIPFENGGAL